MPKYKTLKFSSFEKQQRRPFTIYADTEALLIPKEHVDPSHHKDSAKGEEESEEDLHLEEIADVLGFNKEEVEEILDPDYDVDENTDLYDFNSDEEELDSDKDSGCDEEPIFYEDKSDNSETTFSGVSKKRKRCTDDEEYEKPLTRQRKKALVSSNEEIDFTHFPSSNRKRKRSSTDVDEENSNVQHHPWSRKKLKISEENIIKEKDEMMGNKHSVINKHKMISFAITVSCPPHLRDQFQPIYKYRGANAEEEMVKVLGDIKVKIDGLYETHGREKMLPLTPDQQEYYDTTQKCYICKEKITYMKDMKSWTQQREELKQRNIPTVNPDGTLSYETKFKPFFTSPTDRLGPAVRDHCHWTGKYSNRISKLILI